MDHTKSTTIKTIFDAEEIAASGTVYSDIFGVKQLAGNASIQLLVTGDGTAKVEWVGSLDEDAVVAAFIKPNNANDIVTAFTKTDGPGGDGKHIYSFTIKLISRIAIKITETGGANSVTVTAILALQ
jgi:hypothetical protein